MEIDYSRGSDMIAEGIRRGDPPRRRVLWLIIGAFIAAVVGSAIGPVRQSAGATVAQAWGAIGWGDDHDPKARHVFERAYAEVRERGATTDPDDIEDWAERARRDGVGPALVAFMNTPEMRIAFFSADYDSDREYVDMLFRVLFGRTADLVGGASWVDQLENGADRTELVLAIAAAAEYAER
ncbi:MAG TPA: DUF4214 domain-containing protein [Acidimicrobiales bacterium]|nr:DUF4214 domain-containing protein [Acidimicrobiales bacterium]